MVVTVSFRAQHSWGTVIRSKFGDSSNCWEATNLHSASHQSPWKEISQILSLFLPHSKLSVGCGNKIQFWTDPWLDSQTLSSFPSSIKYFFIQRWGYLAFLILSSHWDFHFRRNLRDPEVTELSSLLVLLQDVRLSTYRLDVLFGHSLPRGPFLHLFVLLQFFCHIILGLLSLLNCLDFSYSH